MNKLAVISTEVLYNEKLSDKSKEVFAIISLFKNRETNTSFPNEATITSYLNIELRALQTHIKKLDDAKVFKQIIRAKDSSNRYVFEELKTYGFIEKEILLNTEIKTVEKIAYTKLNEKANNKTKQIIYTNIKKLAEEIKVSFNTLRTMLVTFEKQGFLTHNKETKTIQLNEVEQVNYEELKNSISTKKETKNNKSYVMINKIKSAITKITKNISNMDAEEFENAKNEIKELRTKLLKYDQSEETINFLNGVKSILIEAKANLNKPKGGIIRNHSVIDEVLKSQDEAYYNKHGRPEKRRQKRRGA